MTIIDMAGLYVHIPFCLKKCNYCDFCSFQDLRENERKLYIDSLIKEINSYRREEKIQIETVFFGGGTPSLLSSDEFLNISSAINETFDLSKLSEFTVEVNPKTLSKEKLAAYKFCGVNRISIGLQSIHKNEQKMLGRIHNLGNFLETYKLVKASGIDNINVDLMYGIPGQTRESFMESLVFVTSLDIPHLSVYGLIIEENTVFGNTREKLVLPDEDTEAAMYFDAVEFLKSRGYLHYEISNYSKPCFESKHNLKYWYDGEYIGVGLAAYSYFEKSRYGNTSNLSEYFTENAEQYRVREIINKDTESYEYAMLRLRLSEGFSLLEYHEKFGKYFLSGREEKIAEYVRLGFIDCSSGRISLTDKGFYISNTILADLL